MKLTKTISALFISLVLLVGTLGQANAAKRLHAAIADWTGGIITCEVAVAILEREYGYKVKQTVFHQELVYGKQLQQEKLILHVKAGQVTLKQTL